MHKEPMDMDNRREDCMWTVGVDRAGESNGGKMGMTVTEQQ